MSDNEEPIIMVEINEELEDVDLQESKEEEFNETEQINNAEPNGNGPVVPENGVGGTLPKQYLFQPLLVLTKQKQILMSRKRQQKY